MQSALFIGSSPGETRFRVGASLRAVGKNAALVTCATAFAKILGLLEKQVIASRFGTGPGAEIYFLLTGLVTAAAVVVRELTEPVLLPLFVHRRTAAGGADCGWGTVRVFFVGGVLLGTALAVAVAVWPELALRWVAPGLTPETAREGAALLRVVAVSIMLLSACSIAQVALHGLERFGPSAAAELAYRAICIGGCWLAGLPRPGLPAIAYGVVLGALISLAVQIWRLPRGWIMRSTASADRARDLLVSASRIWPLLLGVALSQFGDLAASHYASKAGPGVMAARLYAQKVVNLPILLAPYVLSVVSFPMLSRLAAETDWRGLSRLSSAAVTAVLMTFVPLALVTCSFADPIVSLLFHRGHFDASANAMTSRILAVYALGLPAFALEALLVPVFFALKDTRTPALVGGFGVVINVTTLALLETHGKWVSGAIGIPATLVVCKTAKVVVLAALLERRRICVRAALASAMTVALAAAAPAGGLALLLRRLWWRTPLGTLAGMVRLAAAVLLTMTTCAVFYGMWTAVTRRRRRLARVTPEALLASSWPEKSASMLRSPE